MSERMEFRDWSTDAVERLQAQEVEIERLRDTILSMGLDPDTISDEGSDQP